MKQTAERPMFVRSESLVRCDYTQHDDIIKATMECLSTYCRTRLENVVLGMEPVLPLICYSIAQSREAGYGPEDTVFIAVICSILIMTATNHSACSFVDAVDPTDMSDPFHANIAGAIINSLQKQSRIMRLVIGFEGVMALSKKYKNMTTLFSTLWLRAIKVRLPPHTIKTLCIDMLYADRMPNIRNRYWKAEIDAEKNFIREKKATIMPHLTLPKVRYASIEGVSLAINLFGKNMLDFIL